MTTTSVENRFSTTRLWDSWEGIKPTLEKMFQKTTMSKKKRRAAYKLYKHFSKQLEITPIGLATALRNDHHDAVQFFFELSDDEIFDLKKHFGLYHPEESIRDLPGFYTCPLNELFALYFPPRN